MKYTFLIAFLTFLLYACSGTDNCTEPYEVKPISLETHYFRLDIGESATTIILEGNGGYKIYQPKKIMLLGEDVDNDLTVIKARIVDDSRIEVTRLLSDDAYFTVYLMVMDSKGEKALISVRDMSLWVGGTDLQILEDYYLYENDSEQMWDMSVYY